MSREMEKALQSPALWINTVITARVKIFSLHQTPDYPMMMPHINEHMVHRLKTTEGREKENTGRESVELGIITSVSGFCQ